MTDRRAEDQPDPKDTPDRRDENVPGRREEDLGTLVGIDVEDEPGAPEVM